MRRVLVLAFAILGLGQVNVKADEGMWLLSLIEKMNMDEMSAMGLELSADQIYSINQASLKDAVGALDYGSCTAELVSPDGLLLTNHHCGYGEIQAHSSVENDYLKDGFWAMSRNEELPNEGKTITFLVKMEEVTEQIVSELNELMEAGARMARIRSIIDEISAAATEGNEYEASVRSMYNGNRYFLFVTETYRDVRLVGAPPSSIGKFGGDTDNWMWPRHTGDFSMFRVYTGPDGKPADYSPDNVPLKSKHFLPVSLKGVEKDDFTMVMGFPGSTDRYMTSWEVKELLEIEHPNRIKIRGIKQGLMMEDMKADPKVRIQYASKYSRSSNYWKHSIGQSKGLENLNVVGKKEAIEKAFTAWVNQDEARKKLYGSALEDIKTAVEARSEYQNAVQYIMETMLAGMETTTASTALKAFERELAKEEPDEESYARMIDGMKAFGADFFKDYNAATDKKVTEAMIKILLEDLDEAYLPENILEVKNKYKGKVKKYVDNYFKKSIMVDEAKFNAFLENPSLKVLQKDPALKSSLALDKFRELRGVLSESNSAIANGSRLFMKGLVEMYPERDFYSDANSTIRLTYGNVGDYMARDAVKYTHYTTLKGIIEKEDPSNFEFVVDDKLKVLYTSKDYGQYGNDGVLNVCFTTNNDITGGNSGSPVINGKGELIGIAFDGNWEAMSGDIAFETELQKCINVDIRYVLFIIDKFAGATHLVEEMTLVTCDTPAEVPAEEEQTEELEVAEETAPVQ